MPTNTSKKTAKKSRSSNKDGAIRLLHYLQALYDGSKTVTQLLELQAEKELEQTDRRSVQRDIKSLDGLLGVYFDEDEKVWCLDRTDFDKLFEMEDSVALALLVAEKQLAHITPSHILDPLESLFKRANSQLETPTMSR